MYELVTATRRAANPFQRSRLPPVSPPKSCLAGEKLGSKGARPERSWVEERLGRREAWIKRGWVEEKLAGERLAGEKFG